MVTGIFMFVQRYESRHKTIGTAAVCILVVIAVVLTGTTYARNTVWNSELSLWSDVIKKSPGKARGYNNVGMCYYESKDRAKAIPYFQKAIEIDPLDYKALNNLGLSYMGEGRPEKAIESLSRAVKIKPSNGMYHINLGIAFLQKRDTNKGIMEINIGKALRREQRK
ncbi:MAG TPA: tetratricopeptide repeat protein [Nitrospirae bacterium]|nr:tetratricopeptide repeat protein [Nitrospirota bacterium]